MSIGKQDTLVANLPTCSLSYDGAFSNEFHRRWYTVVMKGLSLSQIPSMPALGVYVLREKNWFLINEFTLYNICITMSS